MMRSFKTKEFIVQKVCFSMDLQELVIYWLKPSLGKQGCLFLRQMAQILHISFDLNVRAGLTLIRVCWL
ncbi:hypothetical protein AHAS_Ahas09G0105200 [Arachis hypogaea]